MAVLTSQESADGSNRIFVGYDSSNVVYWRSSMGFQLSNDDTVESVDAYLARASGASAAVQVTCRIETNNAGVPSGTLANANATATWSGSTSTSFAWITFTFATSFTLTANTQYHIVLRWTTESGTDEEYYWARTGSDVYANGDMAEWRSDTTTWSSSALDTNFRVNGISGGTTTSTSTSTTTTTSTSSSTTGTETTTSTSTTTTSTSTTSTSTTSSSTSTTSTSTTTTLEYIYSVDNVL